MSDALWRVIEQSINDAQHPDTQSVDGKPRFAADKPMPVGGGSISRAWRLDCGAQRYFVKLNHASHGDMFAAEMAGLREIAATKTILVPEPVCHGVEGDTAFLVCAWVDIGSSSEKGAARLGAELAAMHRHVADRFGWFRDNTIGSTPQHNRECDRWADFWRDQRLGFQLRLAEKNGAPAGLLKKGRRLLACVDELLAGYHPRPSLLHGDLWGGNWGTAGRDRPIIFDPAVYYGDREADIAMSELFGGFPDAFYLAYNEAWPLDDGYPLRKTLYNLYHILNHFNLFGGGYAGQAEAMTEKLLAAAA